MNEVEDVRVKKAVHAALFAVVTIGALLVIFFIGGVARVFPESSFLALQVTTLFTSVVCAGLIAERFSVAHKVLTLIQSMDKEKIQEHEKGRAQGREEAYEIVRKDPALFVFGNG